MRMKESAGIVTGQRFDSIRMIPSVKALDVAVIVTATTASGASTASSVSADSAA